MEILFAFERTWFFNYFNAIVCFIAEGKKDLCEILRRESRKSQKSIESETRAQLKLIAWRSWKHFVRELNNE